MRIDVFRTLRGAVTLRAWLAALGWLATSLWTQPALAQRVVLVRPAQSDLALAEACNRLRGELSMHGFEVVVVPPSSTSPGTLSAVAERHSAVASVTFARSGGHATADVWVSDRVTGKTTIRTVSTSAGTEGPSLLALRSVELLRISLQKFPKRSPPPADVVGAEPQRASETAPRRADAGAEAQPRRATNASWWLQLEAAALLPLPQPQPAFDPSVSIGHRPWERGELRATLAIPLLGAQLDRAQAGASAEVRFLLALGEIGWAAHTAERTSVDVGGGLGAAQLQTHGQAAPPWVGQSDTQWVAAGGLGAGLTWSPFDQLGFRLATRCLWLRPRPVLSLAGARLTIGDPLLVTSTGVALVLQ